MTAGPLNFLASVSPVKPQYMHCNRNGSKLSIIIGSFTTASYFHRLPSFGATPIGTTAFSLLG